MTSAIIVGAGVIGLFSAVRLAKAGVRVTLLEAEPDDLNVHRPTASTAAAGMLAPFDAGASIHDELALASFDLWRDAARGALWEDGVRFDGGIHVAANEADAAALQARIMVSARKAEALGAGQMRRRTGLHGALDHAVFTPAEGTADPLRVMSGLAMEARQCGVLINYSQDVRTVAAHRVTTHEDEVYEADVVILAAGAWATNALVAAAPALRHVRAGRGHLMAVKTPAPLRPNLHVNGVYLAQQIEDVVLGATLEFDRFDRAVDATQTARLMADLEAVLPGQVQAKGRAWTGIRPMSPDGWPLVGKDGVVLLAAGHSRNGWLLAPITAEILCAYVMGAPIPAAWSALSPQRFEIKP